MNEKFLTLMKSIHARPVMHGIERVEDIALVIYGFGYALEAESRVQHDEFVNKFRQYVNLHFKTSKEYDFAKLIRFYAGGNTHSVEMFFELYNKWLKEEKSA